jgi:hypothetical protein
MQLNNRICRIAVIPFLVCSCLFAGVASEAPTELNELRRLARTADSDDLRSRYRAEAEKRHDYLVKMARYNKRIIRKSDEYVDDLLGQMRDEVATLKKMTIKLETRYSDYLQWYSDERDRYLGLISDLEKRKKNSEDELTLSAVDKQIMEYNETLKDLENMPELSWQTEALQRYLDKIRRLRRTLLFMPPSDEMMEARLQRLFSIDDLASVRTELDGGYHVHMYWILHDHLLSDRPREMRTAACLSDNPLYILALFGLDTDRSPSNGLNVSVYGKTLFFLSNNFFTNDFSQTSDRVIGINEALRGDLLRIFTELARFEADDLELRGKLRTWFKERLQYEDFTRPLHVVHVLGQMSNRKKRLIELYESDIKLTPSLNQYINETAFLALALRMVNSGVIPGEVKTRDIKKEYLLLLEDVTRLVIYYDWKYKKEKENALTETVTE